MSHRDYLIPARGQKVFRTPILNFNLSYLCGCGQQRGAELHSVFTCTPDDREGLPEGDLFLHNRP